MNKGLLHGLTKDQIERAKACSSAEELLSFAKREGIELNEEQLTAIYGGACTTWERKCPKCGSTEFETRVVKKPMDMAGGQTGYKCKKCHHYWVED
ncbi:MAG: hypothetical protein J6N95_05230 [Bacilli bacterium]|nr:hypothetical protein [Bacilli bacterium]